MIPSNSFFQSWGSFVATLMEVFIVSVDVLSVSILLVLISVVSLVNFTRQLTVRKPTYITRMCKPAYYK